MSVNAMHTIEQTESQLWEAADQLRLNWRISRLRWLICSSKWTI